MVNILKPKVLQPKVCMMKQSPAQSICWNKMRQTESYKATHSITHQHDLKLASQWLFFYALLLQCKVQLLDINLLILAPSAMVHLQWDMNHTFHALHLAVLSWDETKTTTPNGFICFFPSSLALRRNISWICCLIPRTWIWQMLLCLALLPWCRALEGAYQFWWSTAQQSNNQRAPM